MKIKEYLKNILPNVRIKYNHDVTVISDFDQDMVTGGVFVYLPGKKGYHQKYLENALDKGAKTIIYDQSLSLKKVRGINYFQVSSPISVLAKLLKFERDLQAKLPIMVGITGTSGKTTVTYLIFSYLKYLNYDVLYLGTHFIYRYYNMKLEVIKTNNTTVNLSKLQNELRLKDFDYDYVIMEVSSQGIMEHRILGLEFDVLSITNLTPEHLDYHHSMSEYKIVKGSLLNQLSKNSQFKKIVLNDDDPYVKYFSLVTINDCLKFSFHNDLMSVSKINNYLDHTSFDLLYKGEVHSYKTYLIGNFNIYNLLNAMLILKSLELDEIRFLNYQQQHHVMIPGRMNIFQNLNKTIILDYAHTEKEVENVLSFIKKVCLDKKIACVIGCGGNRDHHKRAKIGELMTLKCDYTIFTNDNPRDEDPYKIFADIVEGCKNKNYKLVINRKDAIMELLNNPYFNVVLVLGKGCEDEMIIKNEVFHHSDEEIIREYLDENS